MLNERILKKENILRGLKDNIILKPINSKQSLQKDVDDGACDSNDIKLGNTATLEKSLFIDGLESAIEKYNYNSRNILNSKVNSIYANNKPNNINNNNNASNVKNENVSFIRLTFNPTTMSSDSVVRLKKPSTTIFGSKETVNLLRHTKKNTNNNNNSNISREKQTYLEKLKQLEQKRNSANLSTDFICTELKIENENLILNEKTKEKINNFKSNVNEKQGKKQHHQRDEHLINVNEINNEISSANAANNNNSNSNSSTKPEALNELIKTNNKYLIKSEETAYNGNISASTSSFYNNREISKLKNSIIKQKILLNNNNNNKNTEVNKNKNEKLNNNFIQAELVYNSSLTHNHNNRNFKKGSNHNNDVHFILSYNEEKKFIHAYQNISGNNSKRSNQIGASQSPGLDALLTSEKSKNQTIIYNNNKSSLSNRNNNSEEVDYYYYNSSAYYNKVDDVKDSKSKVKKHEKLMPNENSFNLELIKTEDQLIKDQIKYLNNNYDLRLSNSKECLDEDYFSNNNYTDSKNTKIQILTQQQQQQNQQSHDLSNNKLLLNNSNSNSKKKLNKISKQESINKLNIANNNHNNNVEQEEENQNLPLNILKNQDLNKNSLDSESISKTNKKTSLKRLDINSTSNINSNNNNNANNTNESSSSNLQTVNDVVLLREGKSELDKTLDVVLVKKKILKKRTKKKLNEASSYLLESEPNLLNQTKFINELDEKELSNQQTSNKEGLTRLNNKTHKIKARFESDGHILHSSNEDLTDNSKFLNCLENNKKIIEKLYGNLNIFDAAAHNYHSNSPNRIESASSDSSLTMNLINSKEKNKILNPKHILSSSYNSMGNPKSLNALHWINIATTGQNYKTKAELKAESANSASTKKSKELIRTLNNETVVSFVESRSNVSTPSFADETASLICLKNNHKASSKLKFLKVDGQRLDMNNSSLDKYTNSPSRKLKSSVDLAALPNESSTKSNSDAKIKLNKSNTLIFEGVDNITINKLNKKHENARASSNFENYPKLPSSLDEIKDKRFLKLPDLGSTSSSSKPTTDPAIDEKINERIKKSPDLDVNVLVTEQDTNYFGPDKKNKGLSGSASRLKPSIQNAFAKLFSGRSYFGASSSNLNRNNTDLNLNGCIKVIVNEADEQAIARQDKDNSLAQHLLTKIDAKIYDDDQFDMEKENSTLDFNRMKGFQRKYVKIRTKAKPIKKQPNQPAKKVYVDAMTAVAAARDIKTPKDTPDVYESRNDVSKFYDHSKSLLNEGDKEVNEAQSAKKQTDFKEKPVECLENKQIVPDVEEQTNEKVETDNNNNNSSTNNVNTSTKAKETNKETSNRVKINYLTNKKSNLNSSSLRLSRANNEKFKEDFDEASLINLIYVTEAPLAKSTKFYTCQTSSTGQLKPATNRKASLLGYNLADVSDKESEMSSMSDLEAELDAELQIEQIKNEFIQNEQQVNKLQKKIIKKMKVLNSDSMTYLNQPLKSNSLVQIQSQSLILNPTGEQSSNANLNSNNPTSTNSNMYSYDVYKYYERTKIIKLNSSVGNVEAKSVENVGEIREELNAVANEKLSLIESLCESTSLEK